MGSSAGTDVDWNSLLKKLTAVALNLFRKEGLFAADASVMKGLGKSPSDFVHDAITEFYAHREKYSATTEGEAFAVMVTILQNDFVDAYRRHAYKKTDHISEDAVAAELSLVAGENGFSSIEAGILAEHFYKYAGDEQELKDVIDAAAVLAVEQKENLKRDDIANLLGITAEEVTKRNHRLKYRLHADDGRS